MFIISKPQLVDHLSACDSQFLSEQMLPNLEGAMKEESEVTAYNLAYDYLND